jgi:Methyltransferase domain
MKADATLRWLEFRIRALVPNWLRSSYRLARSLRSEPYSRALTPELVAGCVFCASRFEMIGHLPKGGRVIELGTYEGDFARRILDIAAPRELHLVDIDYTPFNPAGLTGPEVTRHEGLTHAVIAGFPDGYFDWIYIDAQHDYDGVMRDARAAMPKVKPGGYLAFNDFGQIDTSLGRYGVHRAVVDVMLDHGWPMRYFAYAETALYDVALQRPL